MGKCPACTRVVTGWLMGEKKLCMRHTKNAQYIYLTNDEQEKYHQVKGITIGRTDQAQA